MHTHTYIHTHTSMYVHNVYLKASRTRAAISTCHGLRRSTCRPTFGRASALYYTIIYYTILYYTKLYYNIV